METTRETIYSHALGWDMVHDIYGHDGLILFAFPSQDGKAEEYSDFGMIDCIADYIEDGLVQVVCVDGNDWNSFTASGDESWRIANQEKYISYVVDELVPYILDRYRDLHGHEYDLPLVSTGCSMGATHALIFTLRYPDVFNYCIGLSGVYHASFFFPFYQNEQIYFNSPVDMLSNMKPDNPILEEYRKTHIILCCGQGAWENESLDDIKTLDYHFKRLKIPAWCDLWGYDVEHHWYWWRKQLPYFLDHVIKEVYGH